MSDVYLRLKNVPYWDGSKDSIEERNAKLVNIPIDFIMDQGLDSENKFYSSTAHLLVEKEVYQGAGTFSTSKMYRNSWATASDIYLGGGSYEQPLNLLGGNYTIRNGVISDRLGNDQSQIGLYYNTDLNNTNNGSSPTNPDGGAVNKIVSYEDYLDIPEKIQAGEQGNTTTKSSRSITSSLEITICRPRMTQSGRRRLTPQSIRSTARATRSMASRVTAPRSLSRRI